MSEINFNNKRFSLIINSENGKVNKETIFEYKQKGNLVTADYYGGTIQYGKIIGVLKFKYLCILIFKNEIDFYFNDYQAKEINDEINTLKQNENSK